MASFFQPGSNDPAIADCEPSRFQTYCNSILPSDPSTQPWHRLLNLAVGATALLVSVAFLLLSLAKRRRRSKLLKTKPQVRSEIILVDRVLTDALVERENAKDVYRLRGQMRLPHWQVSSLPDHSESMMNLKGFLEPMFSRAMGSLGQMSSIMEIVLHAPPNLHHRTPRVESTLLVST